MCTVFHLLLRMKVCVTKVNGLHPGCKTAWLYFNLSVAHISLLQWFCLGNRSYNHDVRYVGDGPEKNCGHIKSAQKTRSKCLRYVSMSHISHYRVFPLATGPLISLESIAEVPNSSLAVFKRQGCFCSFAYWLRQNAVLCLFVTLVCHSLLTERQRKIDCYMCITPNIVDARSESQVCSKRNVSTFCR